MSSFLIAVTAIIAFFILLQFWMRKKSRKAVGTELPQGLTKDDFFSDANSKLLFLYSPTCGPCKQMMPDVDRILEEYPNRIKKVNISQSLDLARAIKIMATPTTVLVKDKRILDIRLGILNVKKLKNMLIQGA